MRALICILLSSASLNAADATNAEALIKRRAEIAERIKAKGTTEQAAAAKLTKVTFEQAKERLEFCVAVFDTLGTDKIASKVNDRVQRLPQLAGAAKLFDYQQSPGAVERYLIAVLKTDPTAGLHCIERTALGSLRGWVNAERADYREADRKPLDRAIELLLESTGVTAEEFKAWKF